MVTCLKHHSGLSDMAKITAADVNVVMLSKENNEKGNRTKQMSLSTSQLKA